MKTTFHILILLLIGLTLQNCGNDCDADCTEIKEAPKEFLEYWYFPEGSWWVYQLQDSTKIVFDTIVLRFSDRYFETEKQECTDLSYPPCISRYETLFTHSNLEYYPGKPDETESWFMLGHEDLYCQYNPQNRKWYLLQVAGNRKLHSYETFVLYPYDTLDTYAYGGKLCGLNESYNFQGESFKSFSVCKPIDPVGDRQIYHKMTFALGIGLVTITYDNEETWNLIDYDVNP